MTRQEVMEKIVHLAAKQRDDGDSGQEFVATSMFAIASVCAASEFPQDEVQHLATTAIEKGYEKQQNESEDK